MSDELSIGGTTVAIENSEFWYLQPWQSSLIPICRQDSGSEPSDCTDFTPSFSDQGMCFARNALDVERMYKPTPYIEALRSTLLSKQHNDPIRDADSIKKNKGSGFEYQYSFLIDNNNYLDIRRAKKLNPDNDLSIRSKKYWEPYMSTHTDVNLAVHSPFDIADIGNNIYSSIFVQPLGIKA